jgi:hypothetical protein
MRAKRKELGGVMSWKEGFLAGLWVSVGVAVLSPLSQWVTHTLISPGVFSQRDRLCRGNGTGDPGGGRSPIFNLRNYMTQSALGATPHGSGHLRRRGPLYVRREAPRSGRRRNQAAPECLNLCPGQWIGSLPCSVVEQWEGIRGEGRNSFETLA